QHGDAAVVELAANLRHREAAGRPVEQAHAQPLLHLQDAAAQPRLLKAQRPAGGGEPAVIDNGNEIIKVDEILHRPIGRTQRWISQSPGRASRCHQYEGTLSQVGCRAAEDSSKLKETAMDVRGYPTGPIDAKGAFTSEIDLPPIIKPGPLNTVAEADRPHLVDQPGM